eukprot:Em0006g1147a
MRVFITRVDLNDIFRVHHIRLLWMQWSGNAATDINDRDDEYAEQDFGVEDAADNDEYADKDFENLVKQFRVDEKMCYFHSQGSAALMFIWFILKECGINVPSLRAFIVLGVDMPQRHLSTDGNPYYSLSLTSIICNCLQTLRYPAAWLVFLFVQRVITQSVGMKIPGLLH